MHVEEFTVIRGDLWKLNYTKTRDLRRFEIRIRIGQFRIFESAEPAVVPVPQTTLTVQQKKLQPL